MRMFSTMLVRIRGHIYRDDVQLSMPHTRLRRNAIREGLHLLNYAFQYHRLKTVIVIKVNMECGYREVMMRMLSEC